MEEQQAKTPQEVIKNKGNVIKTRDDRELILINPNGEVVNPEKCSWAPNKGKTVNNSVFRSRIEPWLTSLFQSEHLSLLCGSGITNAISILSGAGSGTTMGGTTFSNYKNEIDATVKSSAKASGREEGNIEDQIRTANDLLRGLKILGKTDSEFNIDRYLAEYSFRINRSQNKDTIFNKLMKRIVERSPISQSQLVRN